MILDSISILPYQLTFKTRYSSSKQSLDYREGWIISISSNGLNGYGDCCPLDKFSYETYQESGYALEGFKLALEEGREIDFEELIHLSEAHGGSQPSVQFSIDSAIYDLQSKMEKISLNKYLNPKSQSSVKVSYYPESINEVFNGMIVKMKMVSDNMFENINQIDTLLDRYSGKVKLRLDFNGSMDLNRSIRFCKMLEGKSIDYIEQPIDSENLRDMQELSLHTEIPIAVDEMVTDIDSVYRILESQCADVFVLKPMLIGGINKLKDMTNLLCNEAKRYNISSLLESNIGRLAYLNIASAFSVSDESGIATNIFFKNDLCDFPISQNGIITLSSNPGIGIDEISL